MKNMMLLVLIVAFIISTLPGFSQQNPGTEILPDDFSTRAFAHIIFLAGMEHRHAGTENDALAIQYIKDQFKAINIKTDIQPFEFDCFEYTNSTFEVGDKQFDLIGLGINPYNKRVEFNNKAIEYSGKALPIDMNNSNFPYKQGEIEGRTIITNNWNSHFRLGRFKPELIVYVDSTVFNEIRSQGDLNFKLAIRGEFKKYRSVNVIGTLGNTNSAKKEILVTAHFDTYGNKNPGACDNASGTGVILELARYFKTRASELDYIIKFIAFGAEEIGLAGSRNYLHKNSRTLKNCELVFNIDNVGGNAAVNLEIEGGVYGIPSLKGESQLPDIYNICSWEGIHSKWRLLMDDNLGKAISVANHPQWLVEIVEESVKGLGYQFRTSENLGSDQLTFAQAGIVATGLSIRSENSHTPNDVPDKINKTSLKIAGEIAANVVVNTAISFKEK